jgi:uncharacterized protein YycO
MKLRKTMLNALTPVIKWIGSKHMPFTHKLIQGPQYYQAFPKLRPGTILLTRIRGEASNLLIPGFWTHAGVYAPKSESLVDEVVVEAVGKGIVERDLISFMMSKDYVMALEPTWLDDKKALVMKRAAEVALLQVGKPYDYELEFQVSDNKAFYCSELCWYSYDIACTNYGLKSPFVPKETWGEPTITPNDIAAAKQKFSDVWVSDPTKV